jgi:hypothetical protein
MNQQLNGVVSRGLIAEELLCAKTEFGDRPAERVRYGGFGKSGKISTKENG